MSRRHGRLVVIAGDGIGRDVMPEGSGKAQAGDVDAIAFGAAGRPDTVPGHVPSWGLHGDR